MASALNAKIEATTTAIMLKERSVVSAAE